MIYKKISRLTIFVLGIVMITGCAKQITGDVETAENTKNIESIETTETTETTENTEMTSFYFDKLNISTSVESCYAYSVGYLHYKDKLYSSYKQKYDIDDVDNILDEKLTDVYGLDKDIYVWMDREEEYEKTVAKGELYSLKGYLPGDRLAVKFSDWHTSDGDTVLLIFDCANDRSFSASHEYLVDFLHLDKAEKIIVHKKDAEGKAYDEELDKKGIDEFLDSWKDASFHHTPQDYRNDSTIDYDFCYANGTYIYANITNNFMVIGDVALLRESEL